MPCTEPFTKAHAEARQVLASSCEVSLMLAGRTNLPSPGGQAVDLPEGYWHSTTLCHGLVAQHLDTWKKPVYHCFVLIMLI